MKLIYVAMVAGLSAILPRIASASISITSSATYLIAVDIGVGNTQQSFDHGTNIPHHEVLDLVNGESYSKNVFDWSIAGGETILSFDMTHKQPGSSLALTETRIHFTANREVTYDVSGVYSVIDVDPNDNGFSSQYAHLRDLTSGEYLFNDLNEARRLSRTQYEPNANFTLGALGQSGLLIAGHNYEFNFYNIIWAYDTQDSGSSAIGNVTLRIGAAGVVPEPLSVFVWSALVLCAIYLRPSHGA